MRETVILASSSPRRRELLTRVGIPFEVDAPDVDESCDLPAASAVEELSRRKALAAARLHPGRFIVAADTLVAVDGRALGKPHGEEDACRMLRLLAGRTHQVHTGVTVVGPSGEAFTLVDTADVTFGDMSEDEIRGYVASGEPMDKAGSYAIQGGAALWISGMSGCPSGVIGLPLHAVYLLLKKAGYAF